MTAPFCDRCRKRAICAIRNMAEANKLNQKDLAVDYLVDRCRYFSAQTRIPFPIAFTGIGLAMILTGSLGTFSGPPQVQSTYFYVLFFGFVTGTFGILIGILDMISGKWSQPVLPVDLTIGDKAPPAKANKKSGNHFPPEVDKKPDRFPTRYLVVAAMIVLTVLFIAATAGIIWFINMIRQIRLF